MVARCRVESVTKFMTSSRTQRQNNIFEAHRQGVLLEHGAIYIYSALERLAASYCENV